jgi:acylphosphatase
MSRNDASDRTARRYRVSGRVQGVGFRWFVREQARGLGVAGVVRNDPDGSVLVDVVGTAAQLTQLEDALHRGPRGSRVDALEIVLTDAEAHAAIGTPPYPFAIARGG